MCFTWVFFLYREGFADFSRTYTIQEGDDDGESGIFFNMSPTVLVSEKFVANYIQMPANLFKLMFYSHFQEGEFRAVMSWGTNPDDLDFHDLIFDGPNVECEVFYSNKQCGDVSLDVDNTQGGDNGPETITWNAPDTFTHLVYVYDFTGGPTRLFESGAHVTFYGPGDDAQIDVDVPTDSDAGER